jgi:hypothetical protein
LAREESSEQTGRRFQTCAQLLFKPSFCPKILIGVIKVLTGISKVLGGVLEILAGISKFVGLTQKFVGLISEFVMALVHKWKSKRNPFVRMKSYATL